MENETEPTFSENEETSPSETESPASDTERRGLIEARKREAARRAAAEQELQDLRAKIAEQEKAAEMAQLDASQKLEKLTPELEAARSELEQLRAERAARLERVTESNAARLEALPPHLRELADGLTLDPDSMAAHIAKLEKAAQSVAPPAMARNKGGTPGGTSPVPTAIRAEVSGHWKAMGGERSIYPDLDSYWAAVKDSPKWRKKLARLVTT